MAGLRRTAVQFTYLTLLVISSILALGCTKRPGAPIDSARPGDRIATIPASRVDVLTILKADPASGDRWSVELRRVRPGSPPAFQWEIHSEAPLPDARADGELIGHLLDALETLKLASVPRPSTLEVAGLKPPRFALRWSAASGTEELSVGSPAVEPGQIYALVPALSPTRPVKVAGSLLRLLAELSSFERLRQRLWSTTFADDYDELELRRKGKTVLYAQRGRNQWTDRNDKPLKRDAGKILNAIVGASIREFIDNAKEAHETSGKLQGSKDYQAVFTDREGKKTTLTLSRPGAGQLVGALSSARPGAPFRLDRTVLEAWDF